MSDARRGIFAVTEAVELAVVERGGFVESRHAGSAVVIEPGGEIARSLGAPDSLIFGRSVLKPFQALAALTAGAELSEAEVAIACGSHAGLAEHVSLVRGILAKAGCDESRLRCVAAWPHDSATRNALLREGGKPLPIYMECSGKHAAMLASCVHSGWDATGYLAPLHPLQQHIIDTIERLTGEKVHVSSVDGCGAPAHALSLNGIARGLHRIATASPASPFPLFRLAARLRQAVLAFPWAIDGPGRADTVVNQRLGIFSKRGAEGVSIMVGPDGTVAAVKVLDGASRASTLVALRLLVEAGSVDEIAARAVEEEIAEKVLGGTTLVGRVRATV